MLKATNPGKVDQHWQPSDLPTARIEPLPPNPEGTAKVFKRLGHTLEEALAELVDNSIDANAKNIAIKLVLGTRSTNNGGVRKSIERIIVVDDGDGMSETTLTQAMQHGQSVQRGDHHIGKYGIGLKSASFSQSQCVTVISRKQGAAHGRRWNREAIQDQWGLEVISPETARDFISRMVPHADDLPSVTVVVWDKLDSPVELAGQSERHLTACLKRIESHIGLFYHRLLNQGPGLSVTVEIGQFPHDGQALIADTIYRIDPINPFGYDRSGDPGYPIKFHLPKYGSAITLVAHIWPRKSSLPGYRMGGGKVAERQGFYFYRNNRLIQAGGWNTYRDHDSEPHLSLARVEVDLGSSVDDDFRLSVQKTSVEPPVAFIDAVRQAHAGGSNFGDYIRRAEEVYRGKLGKKHADPSPTSPYTPGHGIRKRTRRSVQSNYKRGKSVDIDFQWTSDLDSSRVFEIDIPGRCIYLNSHYRKTINGGTRASATDAQAFKLALFFGLRNYFGNQRLSKRKKQEIEELNQMLWDSLQV